MEKMIIKISSVVLVFLILVSSVFVLASISASADSNTLPESVDNSESKYFPEIGNQGDQGACVCWAQVYYQFTYTMNRSMDVETTPENTFSPTFNYNFSNGGRGQGTWEVDVYGIMKEIGNVPLSTVPHNIKEYNDWFATEEIWQEAMKYRIKDYTIFKDIGTENSQITSPDDTDLYNIKKLLSEGEVLSVTTYISSWDVERIKYHPDAPENDNYVDEYIVRLCDGTSERHRLALVGYNDNIWTDINENGKIDNGEMGALKIANSWGTDRHNDGFMWIAYDALNKVSCVSDCPTVDYRPAIFHDYTQIEVIPYDTDTDLYLRYTLNTADRSQGKIYATATKKDGTEYTFEVGPKRQHGMCASTYSYDGTTNANDGTMVYALSNIVPDITPETLHEYTWSIKFEDTSADGKAFAVKNVEIVDDTTGRISKPTGVYPFTLDGSSKTIAFPQFEEYIPPTTTEVPTTAPTTVAPTTTQAVTTEPAESTITESATTVVTEPVTTTVATSETTVIVEPAETTGEVPVTTQPPVITTIPTESTSETVNTTTSKVYEEYLIGDANNDSNIKIGDATLIQKFIAFLAESDKLNLTNSDCNKDGKVSVKDATCIQKYLAKMAGYGYVGEKNFVEITDVAENTEVSVMSSTETSSTENLATAVVTDPTEPVVTFSTVATDSTEIPTSLATEPTETETAEFVTTTAEIAPTVETTTAPHAETTVLITEEPTTVTVAPEIPANIVTFTNSLGWQGTISCYYWSDSNQTMTSWPGVPMQNSGTNDFGETLYTLEIPTDATYVIFTNGSTQTVDIPYSGGEQKFYPVAPNSEGKYSVENW